MKTISILYQGATDLCQQIIKEDIKNDVSCLVRIYVASMTQEEALQLANKVQNLIPHAKIIGSGASGIVYRGEQYPEGNLIMIDLCEGAQIYTSKFVWRDKLAKDVADEVQQSMDGKDIPCAHILFGEHYYDIHNFVNAFNTYNGTTKLSGGIAGDILSKGIMGFVFTPEGIVENGVVLAGFYGKKIYAYSGVNTSHEPIGPKYRLTDCEGGLWNSIDGKDTQAWLVEQLGVQTLQEYNHTDWEGIAENDILARFPMMLDGHNNSGRFLRYDTDAKGIKQYYSEVPKGTEFRIGYVSPLECVKDSFKICNEIMDQPIEILFCYTCLFRRLYLNNCAKWELSPYKSHNICGAFMLGEIGNVNGTNEFFNGACCILGLADSKSYIRPDIYVFEELHKIEDDNKDILDIVLKKQRENMSKYNDQLLKRIVAQQKAAKEHMYTDLYTGVKNYLKYKEDKKNYDFNKICMVKVENADLLIGHLGQETYIEIICRGVKQVSQSIRSMSESNLLFCYTFNENSFFMVADERISSTHFLEISRILFNQFQIIKMLPSDDVLINRFVVVLDQSELIEIALNTFQANKNMQVPFIICESDTISRFSTAEEFKMIGVLNRALESNGIVAYFQPIHDNLKNCVTKYEALMRIVDEDGTVYVPGQFMDIAKKYHIYAHLSSRMIQKVFSLFQGRKEFISLNFSAYDINSPEMQKIIFDEMDKLGDASNFIMEILEGEEFQNIDVLKDFIVRARKYGVLIAIDDFGTGYSNLLEIASISPDFIKVDGGIIRNLHNSEVNRKLLDVIVYIGQHFGADIIAEFVENEEIQEQVLLGHIRFSQGYYFSRPQPYEIMFPSK